MDEGLLKALKTNTLDDASFEKACAVRDESTGETALFVAARCGHSDLVIKFLNAGMDVNARDNDEATALHHAKHSTVQVLIEASADLTAVDNRGNAALHRASMLGEHKKVGVLLEMNADLKLKTSSPAKSTALHLAAKNANDQDNFKTVVKLVDAKADLNAKDSTSYRATALSILASTLHLTMSQVLVTLELEQTKLRDGEEERIETPAPQISAIIEGDDTSTLAIPTIKPGGRRSSVIVDGRLFQEVKFASRNQSDNEEDTGDISDSDVGYSEPPKLSSSSKESVPRGIVDAINVGAVDDLIAALLYGNVNDVFETLQEWRECLEHEENPEETPDKLHIPFIRRPCPLWSDVDDDISQRTNATSKTILPEDVKVSLHFVNNTWGRVTGEEETIMARSSDLQSILLRGVACMLTTNYPALQGRLRICRAYQSRKAMLEGEQMTKTKWHGLKLDLSLHLDDKIIMMVEIGPQHNITDEAIYNKLQWKAVSVCKENTGDGKAETGRTVAVLSDGIMLAVFRCSTNQNGGITGVRVLTHEEAHAKTEAELEGILCRVYDEVLDVVNFFTNID